MGEDVIKGSVIGIDFGTTNSVAVVWKDDQPVVIPNSEGETLTPSVISVHENGDILVGTPAKKRAISDPDTTIFSIKRLFGHYDEVIKHSHYQTLPIVQSTTGEVLIKIQNHLYSPADIAAHILIKLRSSAENHLNEEIHKAVITVPAYFNDSQRRDLLLAAEKAGLEVLRIINEPTAAAMAYGLHRIKDEKIVVCHLGGGTFDVSILDLGDGVYEVISTSGDIHIGGDDFDQYIINWLLSEFRKIHGKEIKQNALNLQRLREAAENAKYELSELHETKISLPYIQTKDDIQVEFDTNLSRECFENMTSPLLEKLKKTIEQALTDAHIKAGDLATVILCGEQFLMPAARDAVFTCFPSKIQRRCHPKEMVAIGAAILGGILNYSISDVLCLDVYPFSLGIETLEGKMNRIIERNTTIPTKKSEIFSTAADNQTAVSIHILQGEREMAKDNYSPGTFELVGIPLASRGVPQIEVTFDIDANGILSVSAKDLGTGKEVRTRYDRKDLSLKYTGGPAAKIIQNATPPKIPASNTKKNKL